MDIEWVVFLDGRMIDKYRFPEYCDDEYVKNSLVAEGMSEQIEVYPGEFLNKHGVAV